METIAIPQKCPCVDDDDTETKFRRQAADTNTDTFKVTGSYGSSIAFFKPWSTLVSGTVGPLHSFTVRA